MNTESRRLAPVTSVIAEAAEFIGAREAAESSDGATALATALILAGARVEATAVVVTLAKSLLLPGGLNDMRLRTDLAAALRRAEGLTTAREHYEAMAREAQKAAA